MAGVAVGDGPAALTKQYGAPGIDSVKRRDSFSGVRPPGRWRQLVVARVAVLATYRHPAVCHCRNRSAPFVADVGAPDRTWAGWRGKHVTDESSGKARAFRFGIVAPVLPDVRTWREQVRRIADHGYSTVLMPDFPRLQPSPAVALAVAATIADVRVGTWVYAAPLRASWLTAWEAHSLTVLTRGRFEMGIGVGRPGIEDELRERSLPVPSPGQRLDPVRETVAALHALDGEQGRTPVAMAVIGPKARALAAEIADTVTFAMAPDEPRTDVVRRVRDFHSSRDVELSMHIPVVGGTVSPFMAAADELRRRREETGISYFAFGANMADAFAPLVAELAGR